jgi:hypothetical protein
MDDDRLVRPVHAALSMAAPNVRITSDAGSGEAMGAPAPDPDPAEAHLVLSTQEAILDLLAAADVRSAPRLLLVLSIASDGSLGASSRLVLRAPNVDGLNLAVPALEAHQRERLWRDLLALKAEERHQPVEVAVPPTLAGDTIPGFAEDLGAPAVLAACATGILAGRMVAGDRRWRGRAPERPGTIA